MTTAPAWSLTDAEAVTSSIDLARTVGEPVGVPVIVLAIDEADDPARWRRATAKLAHLPVVTIAAGGGIADAEGDIDALVDAVLNRPHAATVAALLGRHLPADPVEAFHAESLAYATLQAGPEHAAWLAMRGRRVRRDDAPRVCLDGTEPVVLTLTRPRLHNLLDRRGRDELTDAFRTIALLDEELSVHWVAEGPSFCAGGDPAEFGTVPDPPTAHLVRSSASPALALAAIRHRVRVHVHGACVGAGIELAAQAATVTADPGTIFRLPELTMGLIPGVGGMWSIARRIGRRRLLTWLLLDREVDAPTAKAWGLVDAIAVKASATQ